MADQIMTILEARVASERWDELTDTFASASTPAQIPAQMVSTTLAQSADDPDRWFGISVWKSREALSEYRASVNVPEGIRMFERVGASPKLSILRVRHSVSH